MLKNCPFCKKDIQSGTVKCPHCTRILIEKISIDVKKSDNQYRQTIIKKESSFAVLLRKTKKILNKIPHLKTYSLFTLSIIFVFIFYSYFSKSQTSQPTNQRPAIITNSLAQQLQAKRSITPPRPNINVVSLNNGTVLSQNATFFKGLGSLEIDNGTGSDAVAKLASTINNKSVLTVYVKKNSKYTISNVRDGIYKLVFNLGEDWDKDKRKFLQNNSYSIFEENFDFTTSYHIVDDYKRTEYSIFRVTLNSVLGGTAQTDAIDPSEFERF